MNMNDKEFVVAKIRSQYIEEARGDLDQLKALDAKVHKGPNIFAYTYGCISALILGTGMSLCMTDLGAALGHLSMVLGIVIGLVGIIFCALAYPLYTRTLKKEREKIAPEILRMTDELLK